jgi:hypothetical protein
MDIMGWSSVSVSMLKRYIHVSDEIREGVAGKLGGLLWGNN